MMNAWKKLNMVLKVVQYTMYAVLKFSEKRDIRRRIMK